MSTEAKAEEIQNALSSIKNLSLSYDELADLAAGLMVDVTKLIEENEKHRKELIRTDNAMRLASSSEYPASFSYDMRLTLLASMGDSGNESAKRVLTSIKEGISDQARKKAQALHDGSPKQKAKAEVKKNWQQWQSDPDLYRSKAAFARDMLDAYDDLTSQKKIEDWCREWEQSSKP